MSYSPTSPPVPVSTQYPVYLFPPMPPTASLMEMIPTMPPMPHLTMPDLTMPPMPHLMMPDLTMPPMPNLSSLTVPPQITSKMFSFFLPSSAPAPSSPTGGQAGREPYAPSSPFPVSLPPGDSPQYVGDCSLLNNYPPQCAGTSTCKYVTSWNKCVAKM